MIGDPAEAGGTVRRVAVLDRIPSRLRLSPRAYSVVTVVALVLVSAIILTGAGVRLTGSGLGCPDWPRCSSAGLIQVSGSSEDLHRSIESGNRAITGLVSIAVILAVLGSLARSPRRRDLTYLSLGLVGGIVAQIILGGITVLTDLHPASVGSHFLVSQLIVLNAVVLVARAGRPPGPRRRLVPERLEQLTTALAALLLVVMVAGIALTGTGPHAGDKQAQRFAFHPPTVARVHGVLVEVFTAGLLVALVWAWRAGAPRAVLRRASVVLVVAIAQSVIGYVQYFNGIPAALVAAHVGGVTLLWITLLWFHLGLRVPEAATEAVVEPRTEARLRAARAGA